MRSDEKLLLPSPNHGGGEERGRVVERWVGEGGEAREVGTEEGKQRRHRPQRHRPAHAAQSQAARVRRYETGSIHVEEVE